MTLIKETREIKVWGTIVWIEVYGHNQELLSSGVDRVNQFFNLIDQVFSTYINTSEVSKLRRGEIEISQCHSYLREIYEEAQNAKNLTKGAFDPWSVTGGFDPSGYVKGWAADRAIEILKQHGAVSVQVNAAGDISLFGGTYVDGVHKPWSSGLGDVYKRQIRYL